MRTIPGWSVHGTDSETDRPGHDKVGQAHAPEHGRADERRPFARIQAKFPGELIADKDFLGPLRQAASDQSFLEVEELDLRGLRSEQPDSHPGGGALGASLSVLVGDIEQAAEPDARRPDETWKSGLKVLQELRALGERKVVG